MILTSIYIAESINSILITGQFNHWAFINHMWFTNANWHVTLIDWIVCRSFYRAAAACLDTVYPYRITQHKQSTVCFSKGLPGHSLRATQHSWVTRQKGVGSNPLIGTPKLFFLLTYCLHLSFFLLVICLPHACMHRHTIHDTHTTNTLHTQPHTHPPTHIHTGLDPLDLQLALVVFFLIN